MHSLIAAILIFAACALAGNSAAKSIIGRADALDAVKTDMAAIKLQLKYSAAPAPQMLSELRELQHKQLWDAVAANIAVKSGDELWEAVVGEGVTGRLKQLSPEQLEPLRAFVCGMGTSDIATQEKHMELCILRAEQQASANRKGSAERAKVARSLGMLAGIAGAILFV
ncbi:MAG: stage III sporulation protein AB [Clostridia bacterium]|nr:stage III sporulation protein AB [Clostridia bacterium]